jgi:uncharacterized membrane protein
VEGSIKIEAPVETVYGYSETLETVPNSLSTIEDKDARVGLKLQQTCMFATKWAALSTKCCG